MVAERELMRPKLILLLALVVGVGHFEANADVVLSQSLPLLYEVVAGKVAVEPYVCPVMEAGFHCPEQLKPRGDPANWATIDDYPSRARRENQSGAVVLKLEIDRSIWRPNSCKVTQSSGFELLDAESCKLILRRARFWPQPTPKGATVPLYFRVRVAWLAPWIE
jgi:TonB family protein